jgi:hypothetical protein
MKIILSFFPVLFAFSGYSQNDYPEPAKHLPDYFIFNIVITNTYVYDANIKAGIIDSSQPINTYRIVYTQNGIKNPLLQKKNSPME